MNDAIFVLNAGSSSLKFAIYRLDRTSLHLAAKGQIENIGTPRPHFKVKDQSGRVLAEMSLAISATDFGHEQAFSHLAEWSRDHFGKALSPVAVGHRVVHGG